MCSEKGANYFYLLGETVNFYNTQVFHTNQSIVKEDIRLLFYQIAITISILIQVQSAVSYIFHHIRAISPGWGYMLTAYLTVLYLCAFSRRQAGMTHGSRHDTWKQACHRACLRMGRGAKELLPPQHGTADNQSHGDLQSKSLIRNSCENREAK